MIIRAEDPTKVRLPHCSTAVRAGHRAFLPIVVLATMPFGDRSASAQPGSFRQFLSPRVGEQKPFVIFDSEVTFQENIRSQDADFQMMQYNLRMALPVRQTPQQEWTILSRVGARDIETRAMLPDTLESLSGPLWDLRLGAAHRRKLANDWIAGGNVEVGSPSDRPFASLDEVRVNANVFVRIPAADERDAWVVLLNYSNVRDFARNVPIPGVAYQFDRGSTFRGLVGIPIVDLAYQPVEAVNLELSYFIPRFVRVRAGYEVFEDLELYGLFAWNNHSYLRHGRQDCDDQLVYYQKQVTGGLIWRMSEHVSLDLSAGYALDRFFYEGENYDDRGDNRIDVSDGPIAQVRVVVAF